MLARTRPSSIAIAVMLGIGVNVYLAIPAFLLLLLPKLQSRVGPILRCTMAILFECVQVGP